MDPVNLPSAENRDLTNVSVLVVEDEYEIAIGYALVLEQQGARVLGPAPDLAKARAIVSEQNPACVLLDLNLKGEVAFKFADELISRGIPTIITTGYDSSMLPLRLRGMPFLQKPIDTREFVHAIRNAVTHRSA